MTEENVKVAVRVRPFNKRERDRNAVLIVDMVGATTTIQDPNNKNEEPKKFNFDYSYWSHDGCKEDANGFISQDSKHPNGKMFADQVKVYNDLGEGVLSNAWEGYNSTLFAYGQTGSGKSWSMVGYGINKGIVPQFCEKMFLGIDSRKAEATGMEYEVTFSMLEIYNEQVRDLLDKDSRRVGLRVRQHPKLGFYADKLKVVPVGTYAQIEARIDEGTTNRTVAATNMNATSSRAHTIVGITLVQKGKNSAGQETTKTAVVNLVDLAGSERADSTGATGDRLKEGSAINQSLSCLGNCIAALADKSAGKKTRVPYRDSVLTKLLKNALGGNSKTIMIAAVSPADINYDESLSTLRYADRAKQIKNSAKVNEDPTEKLIRELQEENEKLKQMLSSGKMEMIKGDDDDDDDLNDADRAQMNKDLEDQYKSLVDKNQQEMEDMKKTYEEKLSAAQMPGDSSSFAENIEKKKKTAHIYNLNMDVQLTGHIVFFMDKPEVTVGSKKGETTVDITLTGPSIVDKHATIRQDGKTYSIEPTEPNVRMLRNGKSVISKTQLSHNDRIIFGTTQYFVFVNPAERDSSKTPFPQVTFDMAQSELATKSGFDMTSENKSVEDSLLQEDMLETMPSVEEANSISEDLDKKMKFELMIVSPEARGELKGRTQVMVNVTNLETKHQWVWTKEKFLNRKYVMQEMFQNYTEGDEWQVAKDRDPFVDDDSTDFHIGSVKIWLQSLAYKIETKEQLEIIDYKGKEVGILNIEVMPCDKGGKEYTEKDDVFVESPEDMIGKELNFVMKAISARGLPSHFADFYAKYNFYKDEMFTSTKPVSGTNNPDWNHKKVFKYPKVTDEFVEFLKTGAIMVQIWGKQKPLKQKKTLNTKEAMLVGAQTKSLVSAANTNTKKIDVDKVRFMMEVTFLKKRQEKLTEKLNFMKKMIDEAESQNKKKISTKLIKDIYNAPNSDAAEKCIKLIAKEKDDDSSDDDSSSHSDDDEKERKPKTEKKKKVKKEKSSTCQLL